MKDIPITPTMEEVSQVMLAVPQELGLTQEAGDEFGPPPWVQEYTLINTVNALNYANSLRLTHIGDLLPHVHWLAMCCFLLGVEAERRGWDTSILVKGNEGS